MSRAAGWIVTCVAILAAALTLGGCGGGGTNTAAPHSPSASMQIVPDLAPFTAVTIRLALDPGSTSGSPTDQSLLRAAISPGGEQRVVIDADPTDAARVQVAVLNDQLQIDLSGAPPTAPVQIAITMPSLTQVAAFGGSVATVAPGFVAADVAVRAETGAMVTVPIQATGTVGITTSAAGTATLAGTASSVVATATTGSSIRAFDLVTPSATVAADTGATVEVTASAALSATATTGSRVTYRGTPPSVTPTTDTGGTISPAA